MNEVSSVRFACLLITKHVKVPPLRSPAADLPCWVMTVGLSLNYTDSTWQGILSHLKRPLPLKSQVCSSCCSHPQIARDLRQPRVTLFFFFFFFFVCSIESKCSSSATLPFFKVFLFHLLEGPAGIRLSKLLPQSQQAAFHVRQESHQALGFT